MTDPTMRPGEPYVLTSPAVLTGARHVLSNGYAYTLQRGTSGLWRAVCVQCPRLVSWWYTTREKAEFWAIHRLGRLNPRW